MGLYEAIDLCYGEEIEEIARAAQGSTGLHRALGNPRKPRIFWYFDYFLCMFYSILRAIDGRLKSQCTYSINTQETPEEKSTITVLRRTEEEEMNRCRTDHKPQHLSNSYQTGNPFLFTYNFVYIQFDQTS